MEQENEIYDFIFAGAGMSGLTLATQLAQHPAMANKRILLIDRDQKETNDRTWCFWATLEEVKHLPPVIFRRWTSMHFYSPLFSGKLDKGDYDYYMVRGVDFYAWAKALLAAHPNINWCKADITGIDKASGTVQTATQKFTGQWIFNSAFTPFPLLPNREEDHFRSPFSAINPHQKTTATSLLQHFKGWIIRTPTPAFDPNAVTFMDFRVAQHGDTRFVYVLPLSDREALVEYTVFSPKLLEKTEYEAELRQYCKETLQLEQYEITDQEFGIIPMTSFKFPSDTQGKMISIGTAGGMVKPSSGYAFKLTQERTAIFVNDWAEQGHPNVRLLQSKPRYAFYDRIFLRVLHDRLAPATAVFGRFFKYLNAAAVFRFLEEKNNFFGDLRAMLKMPKWPFIKAFFRVIIQ